MVFINTPTIYMIKSREDECNMKHFFTNGLLNIKDDNKLSYLKESSVEEVKKKNLLEDITIVTDEQINDEASETDDNPEEEVQDESVMDENAQSDELIDEEIPQDDSQIMEIPPNSKENSVEHEKFRSLFLLSEKLYEYSKLVEQTIKNIDKSNIETETVVKLARIEDQIDLLIDNLSNFVGNVFVRETYEKNLYTYLTLQNELVSLIKLLRKLFKLETMELENNKNNTRDRIIEVK